MRSASAAVCVNVIDSDDDDSANQNISELISTLRTAYRTKDFDRVEEILVSREVKLKREMEDMKKEQAFLYEQGEVGKQDKNRLEDELNKQKGENEELKRLVIIEKAAQDAAQVGERKAVERYEKLLEEVKIGGRDDDKKVILELKKKCCELECAKVKAESEVGLWKRRFEELGIRVSKLEEDAAMLMDTGPQVSKKCGDNASVKEEKCSSGEGRVENGTNTIDVSIQDNGFGCDENTSVAAGAGLDLLSHAKTDGDLQSAARPTSASRAVVDILDGDDDLAPGGILHREENKDLIDKVKSRMLKRKQTTCVNVGENINGGDHEGDDDICPTSKRKMKWQQKYHDTDASRANHCSDSTAFSGSQNVNKHISSSRQDVTDNMNGGIHKVEGNIFPTSTRGMKEEEESIRDTDDCPVNCCSGTAVSCCKNVYKLTSSSRQCEEKMKTVDASRNLIHELVLEGDSDSSSSSSDSDNELLISRITKLQES